MTKDCPGCQREGLPLEAFRKSRRKGHQCPEGLSECANCRDAYCRGCRRQQTVENRPRESARWNRHRKKTEAEGKYRPRDPAKVKARYQARKVHDKPKQCFVRKCTNRGERHHNVVGEAYTDENAVNVIFLCRKHHAMEHIYERARRRTEYTYFSQGRTTTAQTEVGKRFTVKKLDKIDQQNDQVLPYLGQTGTAVLSLPPEWGLQRMIRLEFDNGLEPLAFFKRELKNAELQ